MPWLSPAPWWLVAADPVTVSVLGKMRRLHGVCQANGQRTLNLDDALLKPGAKYEVRATAPCPVGVEAVVVSGG